jgi:hypothetical protein
MALHGFLNCRTVRRTNICSASSAVMTLVSGSWLEAVIFARQGRSVNNCSQVQVIYCVRHSPAAGLVALLRNSRKWDA